MTTKIELIKSTLNEFDPDVLAQFQMKHNFGIARLENHPWMKYRKDQIEAAAASARENFYRLELGGNVSWYVHISDQLKQMKMDI